MVYERINELTTYKHNRRVFIWMKRAQLWYTQLWFYIHVILCYLLELAVVDKYSKYLEQFQSVTNIMLVWFKAINAASS